MSQMRVCHAYGYVIGLEPIRLMNGLPDNWWPICFLIALISLPPLVVSVALPCPMGLRPGAYGCGSAIMVDSQDDPATMTSDYGVAHINSIVSVHV